MSAQLWIASLTLAMTSRSRGAFLTWSPPGLTRWSMLARRIHKPRGQASGPAAWIAGIGERSDAVLRTAMPGNDKIEGHSRGATKRPSYATPRQESSQEKRREAERRIHPTRTKHAAFAAAHLLFQTTRFIIPAAI
jgi:hypothetical protein